MSPRALLRCIVISLLLALLSPPLVGFFVSFSDSEFYSQLIGEIAAREGLMSGYLLAALASFIVLILATLAVQVLTPQLANIARIENDDREIGVVKWFNVNKGYGFITREGGEDVFVHFRAIRGKGHRTLVEGQRVRYHAIENDRGLQAEDVTVIT
ncbi:cold-shock protein [Halotalea alkalilenta]|uniref:DNA-binding protein n=1 Tax=Halotalea alkalilenta TaxID=376489 RepID=A0A172YCF0_9GAMM|nr:cold shock domain-containing protein [Halotalea alkalilenta]ANF56929.1 DNA-binding protein [Halotalea alkalilenta]